ncbi:MAG TPA: hypothetical protein VN493_12705 [Thermoanaerobaculia bacterium]|nr:hypothetical protein [Thermoanaerobaculia bacterium]
MNRAASCPDWTTLAAHRREPKGVEPAGWSEALAHFDGGCKVCRKAALKSDPTLVFRRLPAVPAAVMTESQERAEVDAVRQAVSAMRAASRLDSLKTGKRAFGGFGSFGRWKRWSAAAALTLVGLSIPGDDTRQLQPYEPQAAIFRNGQMAVGSQGLVSGDSEQVTRQVDLDLPILDGGVDLPDARVYQQSYDGLSVVMVVDESINI